MRDYEIMKIAMLREAEENDLDISNYWLCDLQELMQEFCDNYDLNYAIEYVCNNGESHLYKTTRLTNVIGKQWYHIILDKDCQREFSFVGEFVDFLIEEEKKTEEFLISYTEKYG